MNDLKTIGRRLTYNLRHKPEEFGFNIEHDGGWVPVTEVLEAYGITLPELQSIVDRDNKNRFSFNTNCEDITQPLKIRANQGHSIDINLGLPAIKPPDVLYHGTVDKFLSWIKIEGLRKMSRHHVHLSEEIATAEQVAGRRSTDNHILIINAKHMYDDGYEFFISENDVWLTDHVPSRYILNIN